MYKRQGKDYTKAEVKELLQGIYTRLEIIGNPSASDISNYLTVSYTHRTLFRMERCGVVIVCMQSGTERMNVIRHGCRTISDWHIETMYEIDKLFFSKAFKKKSLSISYIVSMCQSMIVRQP